MHLLLVWVHGFKGSEMTFEDFPERLQMILTNTLPGADVESIVYPRFETRGSFEDAVNAFVQWLGAQVQVLRRRDPSCQVGIVLLGHSMGGIVAADASFLINKKLNATTATATATTATDTATSNSNDSTMEAASGPWNPTNTEILAVLAFDTPYFGVSPSLLTETATEHAARAIDTFQGMASQGAAVAGLFGALRTSFFGVNAASTATSSATATSAAAPTPTPPSRSQTATPAAGTSLATKLAVGGAAIALSAVAGVLARDHITTATSWVGDHIQFTSILFDRTAISKRMSNLTSGGRTIFKCYYNKLVKNGDKTFIVKPPPAMNQYFTALECNHMDEVKAHTKMFNAVETPGYYAMAQNVQRYIIAIVSPRLHAASNA